MIVAMAVNTMLLMSSFILIQQMEMGNSSISALPSSEQYSFQDQCPNHLKQKIYEEMPHCAPRDTLVNLPVPYSSDIVEVIPHQVIAQRCQGVCAQGNEHHQCVPNQLGRTNKRFEVRLNLLDVWRRVNAFNLLKRYQNQVRLAVLEYYTRPNCCVLNTMDHTK